MIYIESNRTDPADNLALEAWLLEQEIREDILLLWRNGPCVIIGSNQVAANEVDLELAARWQVPVIRRQTGGGAVYQDLGNLNFSFITDDTGEEAPYTAFLAPLMGILAELGIPAEFNGRNDLCVHGRKISGSAARVRGERLLHHGTLLVDCDLVRMDRLLTPAGEKLARNGVRSVKSRVMNLRELAPTLTVEGLMAAIRRGFGEPVRTPAPTGLDRGRFDDPAWNFRK